MSIFLISRLCCTATPTLCSIISPANSLPSISLIDTVLFLPVSFFADLGISAVVIKIPFFVDFPLTAAMNSITCPLVTGLVCLLAWTYILLRPNLSSWIIPSTPPSPGFPVCSTSALLSIFLHNSRTTSSNMRGLSDLTFSRSSAFSRPSISECFSLISSSGSKTGGSCSGRSSVYPASSFLSSLQSMCSYLVLTSCPFSVILIMPQIGDSTKPAFFRYDLVHVSPCCTRVMRPFFVCLFRSSSDRFSPSFTIST